MRKLAAVLLCSIFVVWISCPGAGKLGPINPQVRLEPGRSYIVQYWDVEPPAVLDPDGLYRPAVEDLAAEFHGQYPDIKIEIRWLKWSEAEAELSWALDNGTPPDIWSDWQGLARMDHILQIPADLWMNQDTLTPAGIRLTAHDGRGWAWPRWIWPRGLLMLNNVAQSEQYWEWQGFSSWLEANNLHVDVNDWQGEFTSQVLVAASGYNSPHWGGQELHDVLTAMEVLRDSGRLTASGEYSNLTKGNNIIGGFTPTFLAWAQRLSGETVMLPLPRIGETGYIPVTGANLIQFRQIKYKGDDHSLASAKAAEHMAVGQAKRLSGALLAAPAWVEDWDNADAGVSYQNYLVDACIEGIPLYSVDRLGRNKQAAFMLEMGEVLQDFWAGRSDASVTAKRIMELR